MHQYQLVTNISPTTNDLFINASSLHRPARGAGGAVQGPPRRLGGGGGAGAVGNGAGANSGPTRPATASDGGIGSNAYAYTHTQCNI